VREVACRFRFEFAQVVAVFVEGREGVMLIFILVYDFHVIFRYKIIVFAELSSIVLY
jgi:hypothetical protein